MGDGQASAERNYSSYLYRFDEAAVLVDCGEPLSRSYKASGLSYDLIDHILLSHMHFDHVGGFFMFMQTLWLERRTKPLVVHAPADAIEPLRQMLHAACLYDELLPFPLQFAAWQPGTPATVNTVRVASFLTSHLANFRERFKAKHPKGYDAFAFLMEAGGLRIGHSADVGSIEDLLPLIERPLDLLVCELAHVEPEDVFQALRGKQIKRTCFIHLAGEHWRKLDAIQARARERLHPMEIVFPRDGDELQF